MQQDNMRCLTKTMGHFVLINASRKKIGNGCLLYERPRLSSYESKYFRCLANILGVSLASLSLSLRTVCLAIIL